MARSDYPLVVEQHVVGVAAMFARHVLDQRALDELTGIMDTLAQYIERKRAQEALHNSEALFRALMSTSTTSSPSWPPTAPFATTAPGAWLIRTDLPT